MKSFALLFAVCLISIVASAQTVKPAIFFTDLTSGPNSGGEASGGFAGAYVTLYGNNFGTTQGTSTVTLNGLNCLRVVSWGTSHLWYQKIVVQLGATCTSGTFVVTTGQGASNAAAFTVRAGNIFCVSTTGSDTNTGKFGSCWKTVVNAKNKMKGGDIVYIQDGVSQTGSDGFAAVSLDNNTGTVALPLALVGYPGASNITIGSAGGNEYAMRTPAISGGPFCCWVIAGISNITANEALKFVFSDNTRVVGNRLTCPGGNGQTSCFEIDQSNFVTSFGNEVYNVGTSFGADKFYHGIYYSTDSNHDEIGWTSVHDVGGCRAIQFHSSPVGTGTGFNQFDIHVHDNLVYNSVCDGINFATIDPSKGPVEAYNNVIYHVGTGPDPSDGSANYACIYFADQNEAGPQGTGASSVYNNTMYDCGSGGTGNHGAINKWGDPSLTVVADNNLVQLVRSEPYLDSTGGGGLAQISGSNNLWFGSTAAVPTRTTANVTSDPLLFSVSTNNFHLQGSSPAIRAGLATFAPGPPGFDHDGVTRGSPPSIGSYESIPVTRPNPPTGLTIVVH